LNAGNFPRWWRFSYRFNNLRRQLMLFRRMLLLLLLLCCDQLLLRLLWVGSS
jgi:hypothetical protein